MNKNLKSKITALLLFALLYPMAMYGQADEELDDDEIYTLSPFEITPSDSNGYAATSTLAGTRIKTSLRDVGSAISVYTAEFLEDVGATDNETLLAYATNAEVGGTMSTYSGSGGADGEGATFPNPNASNRVRGLSAADNTRGFFISDIPWDGFNVDRVDLQRGPNAILFGLGKPAGVINTTLKSAAMDNFNEVVLRVGSYGTFRASADFNHQIIEDKLAIRIALLSDETKFKQDSAYDNDERIYATIKWEPDLFKSDSAYTKVEVGYEEGKVKSNRPRMITPRDNFTSWWYGLDQQPFDPYQTRDQQNIDGDGRGQALSADADFNAWVGGFADVSNNIKARFDGGTGVLSDYYLGWSELGGITEDGIIDNGVGAYSYSQLGAPQNYKEWAIFSGAENADLGQYKSQHLQDASIFDFYNTLIDGPNKREGSEWDSTTVNLVQTFMDNALGFEIALNSQDYSNFQTGLLSNPAIYVDYMQYYQDWDAAGNLVPNPNYGRAFVTGSGTYTSNSFRSERDSQRFTAFYDFDSRKVFGENLFTRIFGRHLFTGLYNTTENFVEDRQWALTGEQDDMDLYRNAGTRSNYLDAAPAAVVYLGNSYSDVRSPIGANIPGISSEISFSEAPLTSFESRWIGGTNWADPWEASSHPFWSQIPESAENTDDMFEADNTDNYVGWNNNNTYSPLEFADGANNLWRGAAMTEEKITSKAIIMQNFWWDGAIVSTFGWREDTAVAKQDKAQNIVDLDTSDPNHTENRNRLWMGESDLVTTGTASGYVLPADYQTRVSGTPFTFSMAVHLNELLNDKLPVNVSLYYNESENFQPLASRVDIYGDSLAPPSGSTVDKSILIATKDNKYSLRITDYESKIVNGSSSDNLHWYAVSALSDGIGWANVFEYDLDGSTIDTQVPGPGHRPDYVRETGGHRFDYGTDPDNFGPGENPNAPDAAEDPGVGEVAAIAAATAREAQNVADFRALAARIDPRIYTAWGFNQTDIVAKSATSPNNFAMTEDLTSKGYEFEFVANPTENWRIAINASKSKAVRSNIGGEAVNLYMETMIDGLNNTTAGDLKMWWGNPGQMTFLQRWNDEAAGPWALTKLTEGANTPELREWKWNLITNYNFTEGALNGFNVGAGYRWQDKIIVGYPVVRAEDNTPSFDLDSPYFQSAQAFLDLWVGYEKQLSDKIHWKIQLNVRNVGDGDKLLPLSVQPDGSTWAEVRIAPTQEWFLTNTFSF